MCLHVERMPCVLCVNSECCLTTSIVPALLAPSLHNARLHKHLLKNPRTFRMQVQQRSSDVLCQPQRQPRVHAAAAAAAVAATQQHAIVQRITQRALPRQRWKAQQAYAVSIYASGCMRHC